MAVESELTKSAFNDNLGYIRRIDENLRLCNLASSMLNIFLWFQQIGVVARELSTEMKPEELDKFNSEYMALSQEVNKWQLQQTQDVPLPLIMKLHMKETWLRSVQKRAGLLIKAQEDTSFAVR